MRYDKSDSLNHVLTVCKRTVSFKNNIMKITIDFDNKTINPVSEVNIHELLQKIQEMFPLDHWEWKIEAAPMQVSFPSYPTFPNLPQRMEPFYTTCHEKRKTNISYQINNSQS